jgi:hypothetical protein
MNTTVETIKDDKGITWVITRVTNKDGMVLSENYQRE